MNSLKLALFYYFSFPSMRDVIVATAMSLFSLYCETCHKPRSSHGNGSACVSWQGGVVTTGAKTFRRPTLPNPALILLYLG